MGLFSRKGKTPSQPPLSASHSTTSVHSGSSSMKSPSTMSRNMNGASNSHSKASTVTSTPHSSFPPKVPKMDLPRPPDPALDPAGYLRSLNSVRERCRLITEKAVRDQLKHFDVDMRKFPDAVSFCAQIIKRDYDAPYQSVPSYGRATHFSIGGRDRIAHLLATLPENVDNTERCRRMIDLVLVSILLDTSPGLHWTFKSAENGRVYKRMEGLVIAGLEMYKAGLFSGSKSNRMQVDRDGLRQLTIEKLAQGLQCRSDNEIANLQGRFDLLMKLAMALEHHREFFGPDGRPGNMVDYLLAHPSTKVTSTPIVAVPVLWNLLMSGLSPLWGRSGIVINGVSLGDAWPCASMPQTPSYWESILPFHKLTQWVLYSLMQPMQMLLKIQFAGVELLVCLPDYRNGGLLIDMGVLTLKKDDNERGLRKYGEYCKRIGTKPVEVVPMFETGDDVIVEWRGVTVGLLDRLCSDVNRALIKELAGHELTPSQVLEAGISSGGLEIAEVSRPNTQEPPILVDGDGSVFRTFSRE